MKTKKNLNNFLVMSVFLLATLCTDAAGGTIYVDADAPGPTHDGTSWANAYIYLQDALAVATSGDEIQVAQGTYKPDEDTANPTGTGVRIATFQLINSVTLRGGYGGETILSGDIGTEGDNSDNSYHVVTGSGTDETAVLDGFTITEGNANGTDWESQGGGMFNKSGSPTVTNCTFDNNSSTISGGGMSNFISSPTLTNCVFSKNSTNNNGGGILCHGSSSPTITKCIISENTADFWGGGIQCNNSSPTIIDCTISRNAASVAPHSATGGGGIYCRDSSPTIINCTISGNTTGSGNTDSGGIGCMRSSPTIINCTISNNTSTNSSGGIGCYWNSSPTITNCIITGNTTGYWGGGINCYESSSPTITNCIITGNMSKYCGGGIRCYSSSPIITNCTFSGNLSDSRGGGIFNHNSSPTLSNCILWGDSAPTGPEIFNYETSSPTVSYSDVQGGWSGIDNINADPLFADSDGRLLPGSPCIDAGDNSAVTVTTDLDGNPRIVGLKVDMGAYEFQEPSQHAAAQTKQLIDEVVALNLQQGIENSLDSKLDAVSEVLDNLNENNDVAAINALQAFINAVEALRGNKITNEDADELIAAAQYIIDLLMAE